MFRFYIAVRSYKDGVNLTEKFNFHSLDNYKKYEIITAFFDKNKKVLDFFKTITIGELFTVYKGVFIHFSQDIMYKDKVIKSIHLECIDNVLTNGINKAFKNEVLYFIKEHFSFYNKDISLEENLVEMTKFPQIMKKNIHEIRLENFYKFNELVLDDPMLKILEESEKEKKEESESIEKEEKEKKEKKKEEKEEKENYFNTFDAWFMKYKIFDGKILCLKKDEVIEHKYKKYLKNFFECNLYRDHDVEMFDKWFEGFLLSEGKTMIPSNIVIEKTRLKNFYLQYATKPNFKNYFETWYSNYIKKGGRETLPDENLGKQGYFINFHTQNPIPQFKYS